MRLDRYSAITLVAPLTGLSVPSVAVFKQIRAVDRRQLVKKLGKADAAAMAEAELAIQASFGLPPRGAS
jgi:mRNA-degrading endonuclease toxin of MazEF toxin-antitoxin module